MILQQQDLNIPMHTKQKNVLKNNFMKKIEAIKEEMKNSLNEIEEKKNKKIKKSTNPLKKAKKKQSNR